MRCRVRARERLKVFDQQDAIAPLVVHDVVHQASCDEQAEPTGAHADSVAILSVPGGLLVGIRQCRVRERRRRESIAGVANHVGHRTRCSHARNVHVLVGTESATVLDGVEQESH